jgi:hypothetical protein
MGTLKEDVSHVWQYLAEFFLEWEIFQIKVLEKIKIHVLYSVPYFRKSCSSWDNVKKYGGARVAADDKMAGRCMLYQ